MKLDNSLKKVRRISGRILYTTSIIIFGEAFWRIFSKNPVKSYVKFWWDFNIISVGFPEWITWRNFGCQKQFIVGTIQIWRSIFLVRCDFQNNHLRNSLLVLLVYIFLWSTLMFIKVWWWFFFISIFFIKLLKIISEKHPSTKTGMNCWENLFLALLSHELLINP